MSVFNNIAGVQSVSLVDWDSKVSSVIFLYGCNLRCPYCHNKSVVLKNNKHSVDIDNVFEIWESHSNFVDGIVITGGEPLIHEDLPEFITKVKEDMKLPIKLDTNGTYPDRLEEVIDMVDYVAMDIKAPFDHYAMLGGHVIASSLYKSIQVLSRNSVPHEFRMTCWKPAINLENIEDILSKMIKYHITRPIKLFLQDVILREEYIIDPSLCAKSDQAIDSDERDKIVELCSKLDIDVAVRG